MCICPGHKQLQSQSHLLLNPGGKQWCTAGPLNNGHIGDEHFVHCSEVVTSSEIEVYGQNIGRGQTVCPL